MSGHDRTVLVDVRRASWRPNLGISRYARSLVRHLLEIEQPGFELELLDLRGENSWPTSTVRTVGRRTHFLSRLGQEQFAMALASRDAGLLHLPWYEGPAAPACPVVLNVHDLDTVDRPWGYSWRFRSYYNALLELLVRRAARIIVPSETTLEAVEARWPGRPYIHIPYGVDECFSPLPRIEPTAPTILFTGGYGERKQIPHLLAAFDRVASKEPEAKLVMTGAPPPETTRTAEGLRHGARVRFTGMLSNEELAELYRSATVVAYPSALEGFGFPVLEAFASGTPVVAARGGSIPEVAGGAALLVEPGNPSELADALMAVLDDRRRAEALRERGLARAGDFSWRACAESTREVYRVILDS